MTTTADKLVPNSQFISREYISHEGEVYATGTLAPSVLPMLGFSLNSIEQSFWLKAVRNKGAIKKGEIYRLAHIHTNGQIIVALAHPDPKIEHLNKHFGQDRDQTQINGLWPMDLFAEYIEQEVKLGTPAKPKAK